MLTLRTGSSGAGTTTVKSTFDQIFRREGIKAVSIEGDGQKAESIVRGMAAIREKGKQWADNLVEVHGGSVSDPVIADGWFSVAMGLDATYKDMGRVAMKEIAVYQVRDGKITHEQFFYHTDPS